MEVDEKLKPTIENVYLIIQSCSLIKNKDDIRNKFWDMFVVDALLGNSDRHFDNWGILEQKGEIRFAPIYDCGSVLGALFCDEKMAVLLKDPVAFKNEEFNVKSCYSLCGKRIFYHEIFKSPPVDLIEAIKRTVPKIKINEIHGIVNETEFISDVRKEYLIKALDIRYNKILLPAFNKSQ